MSDNGMGLGLAPAPAVADDRALIELKLRLEGQLKNGAGWFFWIAGLSMINTVIVLTGSTWHFIFGLGVTSILDAVAARLGAAGQVAALVVNAFIAGVLILFGVFGRKGARWAFIVGMVIYALDAIISLTVGDLLGTAFHAFALYSMYRGMATIGPLQKIKAATLATTLATTPTPIEP